MANIIDYVRAASESFTERPLNRVDSLVLSWLAYARIPEEAPEAATAEGISLTRLVAEKSMVGMTAPMYDRSSSEALLNAVAASPRFGAVRVALAQDKGSLENQMQFAAVTFIVPGDASSAAGSQPLGAFVAFRGTDDTLVGWKENFNMAFLSATPSQVAARDYLNQVAEALSCPLWVGGHSKGGNLAVYATSTCAAQARARVQTCFMHDAPGFTEEVRAAAAWTDAENIIDRTVPEESIIGLLFGSREDNLTVVQSTNPGILQHAPFSWVVEGNDFATAGAISYDAYRTNKRLGAWLKTLDAAQRERFVGIVYKLATATGEPTLSAILGSLQDGSLDLALRRLDGLPEADRVFFMDAAGDLVATLLLGAAPTNPQTPTERADDAQDKIDDLSARFDDRMAKLDKYLGL